MPWRKAEGCRYAFRFLFDNVIYKKCRNAAFNDLHNCQEEQPRCMKQKAADFKKKREDPYDQKVIRKDGEVAHVDHLRIPDRFLPGSGENHRRIPAGGKICKTAEDGMRDQIQNHSSGKNVFFMMHQKRSDLSFMFPVYPGACDCDQQCSQCVDDLGQRKFLGVVQIIRQKPHLQKKKCGSRQKCETDPDGPAVNTIHVKYCLSVYIPKSGNVCN